MIDCLIDNNNNVDVAVLGVNDRASEVMMLCCYAAVLLIMTMIDNDVSMHITATTLHALLPTHVALIMLDKNCSSNKQQRSRQECC